MREHFDSFQARESAEVTGALNILSLVPLGSESPLPAIGIYITRARRLVLCSEQASGSLGSGGGRFWKLCSQEDQVF